ncbi:hypothetical protein ACUNV4_05020 [Granulosicoccus sp. 3-233]|uniref:hypothetical protein n=1 Tax=Granulosicoccus sp. 3-233 TaxID=3417969 RepID=UPI003D349B71
MEAPGNEGVAGRVKLTLGSVGYVESGFASRLGLPMALLENQHGEFVAPTIAAGQAAMNSANSEQVEEVANTMIDPTAQGSYPITTYTWFLIRDNYESTEKSTAIRNLLGWILTEGQNHAESLHYLPLPATVSSSVLASLQLQ